MLSSSPSRADMIGWRERVTLPSLSQRSIVAKVDTGAKTSSLHAPDLTIVAGAAGPLARFDFHPDPDHPANPVPVQAPVIGFRTVRSSNGVTQRRPVIRTEMRLGEHHLEIDLTLTCRAAMDHRMLLGRRMLEDRFVVDPGRSFLITERILS
jgi:hypothetical protein